VDEIPEALSEERSNNASTIFRGDQGLDVATWFQCYLVCTRHWDLHHIDEDGGGLNVSNSFHSHSHTIVEKGYTLKTTENNTHATLYLQIKQRNSNKVIKLSGRADYIVAREGSTYATYMDRAHILAVIKIQSQDDEELCELQMQVYLLIFMNIIRPSRLIGLLALKDGRVKAYKAIWDHESKAVYEQNDYFHVSNIGDVLHSLLSDA
jgi:hypothetical protein